MEKAATSTSMTPSASIALKPNHLNSISPAIPPVINEKRVVRWVIS